MVSPNCHERLPCVTEDRLSEAAFHGITDSMDRVRKSSREVAAMFQWLNDVGYDVNVEGVRKLYPRLLTFNNWLKQSAWATTQKIT